MGESLFGHRAHRTPLRKALELSVVSAADPTDRVIEEFVEMIDQIRPRLTKLGIVGAGFIARRKIRRRVKQAEAPEEAKSWLVSEGEERTRLCIRSHR